MKKVNKIIHMMKVNKVKMTNHTRKLILQAQITKTALVMLKQQIKAFRCRITAKVVHIPITMINRFRTTLLILKLETLSFISGFKKQFIKVQKWLIFKK